jgi:TonB-linked SusC/RagA family outer membrane protein
MNGPKGLLLILNYIYIMEKMKNLFVMFFLLFLFVYSLPVEAQGNRGKPVTIDVKGTVVSVEDGLPVVGATVLVEGTEVGTATDNDGKFVLNGVSSDAKIRFSYIGMISQVLNAQSTMLVKLATDTELLEEVVVTGIFERKKEGFTGSANRMEGDEIRKLTSGNVLVAIQALDPGFRMGDNILSGSNPNSIPEFNMRGQSSMGDYSTDETVIMRGDIDTRPNQPLFVLDGIIDVGVTKILDLDPAQIESITLLKDAAAMAIYGSQASNGVVVVETKAPMAGKLRVSYNGNYKVEYPDLTDYDLLNAAEKLELEKRAGYYDAIGNTQNQVNRYNSYRWKLLEIQRGVNSYWMSQPLESVFAHRHGVNLEGGNESLRYKLYVGVNQSPGVMKGTGVYGKNASLDIRYRYKGLLISNIAYVDYTKSDRTSPYGNFREYTLLNPYYRITDQNGAIKQYLEEKIVASDYTSSAGMTVGNPMYNTQFNSLDRNVAFEVRDAFRAEYTPIPNLRLALDFTVSKSVSDLDIFKSGSHTDFLTVTDLNKRGSYSWTNSTSDSWDLAFTVNYNKVWQNKHVLSTFARYSINERNTHSAGAFATGFPNDNMDEIFLGALVQNTSGDEATSRAFGGVITGSYTYDQRYAVDFNARMDASSQFGRNNRYAPFWSTGARWNADKEKFIKKLNLFDELVLRATYGVTGTQGFSPYQALQMYTYRNTMRLYQSSDVVGTLLYGMGNPDLQWQTTNAFNLGLDFNMFKRVLSGRLEYYYRLTKNTVLDYSLAPSVGFNNIKDNIGNISNEGYEFTLRLMPYNNLQKQMNFSFVMNGSHNKNTIKKISNALKIRNEEQLKDDPNNPNKLSRPLPRYEEGYSQTMIWAVRSLGIDPMSGREIFLNRNGERVSEWNSVDMVPVGDTEPDLTGTLGANFNWRGLSVNLSARYTFGGQYYNKTLLDKVENADLSYNVDRRAFTDRWQNPGDLARFKAVTRDVNGSQTKASSRFLMDRNELVLNTINVQYRFEQKREKFLRQLGLSSATIAMYMEDLFHWSTIKQERGINYPMSRQISMSLNLTF